MLASFKITRRFYAGRLERKGINDLTQLCSEYCNTELPGTLDHLVKEWYECWMGKQLLCRKIRGLLHRRGYIPGTVDQVNCLSLGRSETQCIHLPLIYF